MGGEVLQIIRELGSMGLLAVSLIYFAPRFLTRLEEMRDGIRDNNSSIGKLTDAIHIIIKNGERKK